MLRKHTQASFKKFSSSSKTTVGVLAMVTFMGVTVSGCDSTSQKTMNVSQLDNSANTQNSSSAAANVVPSTGSIKEVVAKVVPSVVSIRVETPSGGRIGSGVVYSKSGLILTNNHVVDGSYDDSVKVVFDDSTELGAKVLKTDKTSDLAVLKLTQTGADLHPIVFAKTAPAVGDAAIAVGSPLGLSETVTNGIVSAINRPVQYSENNSMDNTPRNVISSVQTNAAINPGNSGGALVNSNGELIGINSSIATTGSSEESGSIGIGFAVPSSTVQRIVQYLAKGESFPYGVLGIKVTAGTEMVQGRNLLGAQITKVDDSTAAQKAGLQNGDVIVEVNNVKTAGNDALVGLVRQHAKGDVLTLAVARNGKLLKISVKLQ